MIINNKTKSLLRLFHIHVFTCTLHKSGHEAIFTWKEDDLVLGLLNHEMFFAFVVYLQRVANGPSARVILVPCKWTREPMQGYLRVHPPSLMRRWPWGRGCVILEKQHCGIFAIDKRIKPNNFNVFTKRKDDDVEDVQRAGPGQCCFQNTGPKVDLEAATLE